ncbi:MAG: site-specific integrase [Firmicutes bacterium]|nr:site-specific integrase [Bacillota bacterium]
MICRSKKCQREISGDSIYCSYCGIKQTPEKIKELKKPNGYGSVIKLSGRRRKPWAVRVSEMVKNKQKFRYLSYHETKTEALKALAQEQITPTSPKANITFKELYEEWLETPDFIDISKQTQDNYTAAYKHLAPLHSTKFTDIRTGNMQQIIRKLDRSFSTKTKIKILCGLLYKYAIQNDVCNKNYAEFIKIPSEKKECKTIFTDLELEKMEKCGLPYADTIIILCYTGLRISELLTLTRFSVNLKDMTLTGGLKTDSGRDRTVPIHPKALPHIKKYYDEGHDLLITKSKEVGRGKNKTVQKGLPITSNYYRKYIFKPIMEELKIEGKTPHATRHTAATLMTISGMDTNAIKMILGHADYAFTADTYTHIDLTFLQNEINKI